ncbi:MAG: CRTAC1 family protein [Candidatus Poribacteria bacterium]
MLKKVIVTAITILTLVYSAKIIVENYSLENSSNTHDVTFFDYNNDGFLDLYVANGGFIAEQAVNLLYRNNGDGTFTNVTAISGVGNKGWAMSAIVGDYNNDGYMDIYVANWNSSKLGMPNVLYRNNGDGTFTEISKEVGLRHLGNGHGVIFGDYDNDGDLDIYLVNGGRDIGQPNALYRNYGNRNNWLKVKLMGRISNRWGIGAKVKAFIDQSLQIAEVGSGSGFGGQNSLIVHFGLGTFKKVNRKTKSSVSEANRLEVNWTSGIQQTLRNISANQILVIQELMSKN